MAYKHTLREFLRSSDRKSPLPPPPHLCENNNARPDKVQSTCLQGITHVLTPSHWVCWVKRRFENRKIHGTEQNKKRNKAKRHLSSTRSCRRPSSVADLNSRTGPQHLQYAQRRTRRQLGTQAKFVAVKISVEKPISSPVLGTPRTPWCLRAIPSLRPPPPLPKHKTRKTNGERQLAAIA